MPKIYLLLALLILSISSQAQITGKVFRDYNGDGIQQTTGVAAEPGVMGATVNAYDDQHAVISTTTTALDGSYTLPYTVPVRLEFEVSTNTYCQGNLPEYSGFAPNGESIRFISTNNTVADYAVQNPAKYVINQWPFAFMPRFNRGDPLVAGTSATADVFYGHIDTTQYTAGIYTGSTYKLQAASVGAVWGTAYSNHAKKIFTSAFLKRHVGLGPMGSGGIYLLEPSGGTFNVTNFYDMDANGYRTRASSTAVAYGNNSSFLINAGGNQLTYLGPVDPASGAPEGLGVIGVNGVGGRDLQNTITGPSSNDCAMLDQVAKAGLGDIELTDDGKFLYVTNQYDRKVYRLELDNPMNPQSVTAVTSYDLPTITVNNGLLRGFALTSHGGKMYVGAISTGENGGINTLNGPTDVYAYVFEINDPMGTPVFNPLPVFSMPMNYHKGNASLGGAGIDDHWYPWSANTSLIPTNERGYPTPILSNICFTHQGDLILDFADRSGHQFGDAVKKDLTGTTLSNYVTGGDIVIAGVDCTTGIFTLENNGSYTSNGVLHVSTSGVNNNQGIGGGEFFFGDNGVEPEGSNGACKIFPYRDSIIATMMDCSGAYTNGTNLLQTLKGGRSTPMVLANSSQFAKGNSMGEVELAGDAPLLQIGNRVWKDTDGDGIQDPGEAGINNVTLELYADFNHDNIPDGAALGSTTTASDGNYLFDASNVADGDPVTPLPQPGPVAYQWYLVAVASSDWSGGAGINELYGNSLTLKDIGGTGQPDVRDNDALLINNIPMISLKTGMNGKNDHEEDMGFIVCKPIVLSDVTINCFQPTALIGTTPVAGSVYSWSPGTGLSSTNTSQTVASPDVTTTYTLTVDQFCTAVLTVTVDKAPPGANAGPTKTVTCADSSAQIGTPAVPGVTYQWSPSQFLDNSQIAQPTATPPNTITYTLTTTAENGCTSTSTTEVIMNDCCTKLTLPNSFSPNNDGLNDKFGIIELENVQGIVLEVYNRWGEQVFYSNHKEVKWDGKYKGKDCDMGTYFYIVYFNCANANGGTELMKGDVTLIR